MSLEGMKIMQLVYEEFEDLELWYPVYRLREEGAIVHLVGEHAQDTYFGKYGVPATAAEGFDDINPDHYDAILIPGGWAPDKLRRFTKVKEFVSSFDKNRKPIGIICHAGWVLASAKILKGRVITSTTGIKDDMENAGAAWVNEPAVTDGNIISAQKPADLPAYCQQLIKALEAYKNRKEA